MDTDFYADRRRSPRIPLAALVQLQSIDHLGDPGERGSPANPGGLSHDVSEGGMCLFTQIEHNVNERLLLAFEYVKMGCLNITSCEGSVVWSKPLSGDCRYMLGIRFRDVH
ncbi:PilZ domain-containing protein [Allochromatium vinosum]|uniref:Type IV pilus assembly PilZ n=1 Tax=Allochromatium vinosum (strain ATCC 17899 / DSM 180 / NBRC 103801 / NCIMB 10441 / D) TaxID=572477 RepID=D3RVY2_ALLVD|nr:PilZ domain-containing protein [Allochromatium vinosum]ADC63145.1 type IV pilus assembly PilZ [Allochromatium vinosum DSM 180]